MIASLNLPKAGTRIGNETNLCSFLSRRKYRGKAGEFLCAGEEFSVGEGKFNRRGRARVRLWEGTCEGTAGGCDEQGRVEQARLRYALWESIAALCWYIIRG